MLVGCLAHRLRPCQCAYWCMMLCMPTADWDDWAGDKCCLHAGGAAAPYIAMPAGWHEAAQEQAFQKQHAVAPANCDHTLPDRLTPEPGMPLKAHSITPTSWPQASPLAPAVQLLRFSHLHHVWRES